MSDQAQKTPLLDLLDCVPRDARLMYIHADNSGQNIPFGRLAKKSADRIRELEADLQLTQQQRDENRLRAEAAESKLRAVGELQKELLARSAALRDEVKHKPKTYQTANLVAARESEKIAKELGALLK